MVNENHTPRGIDIKEVLASNNIRRHVIDNCMVVHNQANEQYFPFLEMAIGNRLLAR